MVVSFIVYAILIGGLIGYLIFTRKFINKRIHEAIEALCGEIDYITRLSFRDRIYVVEYHVGEQRATKTVKFLFGLDNVWY